MTEQDIQQEFDGSPDGQIHTGAKVIEENGQWGIHCDACGAQFTVNAFTNGCSFDQVTEGDGHCEEQAEENEPYCESEPIEPEADSGNPHLGEDEDVVCND